MNASPEKLTITPVAHKRLQIHYIWPAPSDARLTTSEIIEQACETAGISVAEARGKVRTKAVSERRFQVMAILRARQWSLPKIGKALGGRDHTTIWHGLNRWEAVKRERSASNYLQEVDRLQTNLDVESDRRDKTLSSTKVASPEIYPEKSL